MRTRLPLASLMRQARIAAPVAARVTSGGSLANPSKQHCSTPQQATNKQDLWHYGGAVAERKSVLSFTSSAYPSKQSIPASNDECFFALLCRGCVVDALRFLGKYVAHPSKQRKK